jgi:phosphatidate cytidylyltransferase
MSKELNKRIKTSIILIISFFLMIKYNYLLLIGLIISSVIIWIEFNNLISRMIKSKKIVFKLYGFLFRFLAFVYIFHFSYLTTTHLIFNETNKIIFLYTLSICIASDIGGFVFGKFFKGRKLTKISPKKTISGAIGSIIFSLTLIPIYYEFDTQFLFLELFIFTLLTSIFCQAGDLFISYLKRKANVKDTGDLLPGHGGFLDRFDGILFGVPVGLFILLIILPIFNL